MEIGLILNYQGFTDLSKTDINTGWSVSNNKIVSPADVSKPLQFSYVSGLKKWKKTVVANKKTLKLYIYNTAENFRAEFYINANNKLCGFFSFDNSTSISADSLIYNDGDLLEFSINKVNRESTFTVKNLNTNQIISLATNNVAYAIHKLRLLCAEVTEISSYVKESTVQFEPATVVIGDSITDGSAATSDAGEWVNIAGFTAICGPGDRSNDALLLFNEILNVVKPKRVIYAMGTNDVTIDNWKSALTQFEQKMNSNKITFIPVCPYANGIRSMQPYYDYIVSKYNIYFDFYTTTKQSNSTALKTEFNSGDNVHLNDAGHLAVGNYVLTNQYYDYFKSFSDETIKAFAFFRRLFS